MLPGLSRGSDFDVLDLHIEHVLNQATVLPKSCRVDVASLKSGLAGRGGRPTGLAKTRHAAPTADRACANHAASLGW